MSSTVLRTTIHHLIYTHNDLVKSLLSSSFHLFKATRLEVVMLRWKPKVSLCLNHCISLPLLPVPGAFFPRSQSSSLSPLWGPWCWQNLSQISFYPFIPHALSPLSVVTYREPFFRIAVTGPIVVYTYWHLDAGKFTLANCHFPLSPGIASKGKSYVWCLSTDGLGVPWCKHMWGKWACTS